MTELQKTGKLLVELISRESVTPNDADCQTLLGQRLQQCGFTLRAINGVEVDNLWATRGNDSDQPILVFAGHTDVVPTGPLEAWDTPPFEPSIRNGRIYGRGATDMKSGLAAMIIAIERFTAEFPNTPLRLGMLLTSDEEGPATEGTTLIIDTLQKEGQHIDYAIVGEASCEKKLGDRVMVGRRGSLSGHLIVQGMQGHVAYPLQAENAVHRSLAALQALCDTQWDNGNENFPPTGFQITNYHAGTGASNVIPGTAAVDFNFRFSTEVTPEQLQQRVEKTLNDSGIQYDLSWNLSASPFLSPEGKLRKAVGNVLTQEFGQAPTFSTAGGTSDARFIAPTGTEVLELGPVNTTAHKVNEYIEIADLEKLSELYYQIMVEMQ